jgi:hypothetical protein
LASLGFAWLCGLGGKRPEPLRIQAVELANVVVLLRLCGNVFSVERGRTRFVGKGECRLDQRSALDLLAEHNDEAGSEHVDEE